MTDKPKSYKVKEITFPRIHCVLTGKLKEVEFRYSINPSYISPTEVSIQFGIHVVKKGNASQDGPENYIVVEGLAVFEYINCEVSANAEYVEDIPLSVNMLATMYPFLREKVHYLLFANKVNFFLDSFNIVGFIRQNHKKFPFEKGTSIE